jgi:hypothetical protein
LYLFELAHACKLLLYSTRKTDKSGFLSVAAVKLVAGIGQSDVVDTAIAAQAHVIGSALLGAAWESLF